LRLACAVQTTAHHGCRVLEPCQGSGAAAVFFVAPQNKKEVEK